MRLSREQVPQGGWKYQQGRFWIEGDSWEDLVNNVRSHIINNGMPFTTLSDLELKIEEQIKKLHPEICIT